MAHLPDLIPSGMEKHHEFTTWAIRNGVEINGIAAHRFPARGLGIIAQKRIKRRDLILSVPARALRTVQTIPKTISEKLEYMDAHGRLAVDMCSDSSAAFAPWKAVLPTPADLTESMPILWDSMLQTLLPPTSYEMLESQQRKFQAAWKITSGAFPQLNYEVFHYHWLLVNTRTFYWTTTPENQKTSAREDAMALNPFADYFNHADEGCVVERGPQGFRVFADRVYERGEEIYITYGTHGNDFLLVEYGFVPLQNKWDEVKLDKFVLRKLSKKRRDQLEEVGYLGNYIIDRDTAGCHRTQVALRLLCVPFTKWLSFVNGQDDGQRDQPKVDQMLLQLLRAYQNHAGEMFYQLSSSRYGSIGQRQMLVRRWEQIVELLQVTIKTLETV